MSPQAAKKILFLFIARGLMGINLNDETNHVVLHICLSSHNDTLLAIQDDTYWKDISTKDEQIVM